MRQHDVAAATRQILSGATVQAGGA
jgi:hypothetical protein